MVSGLSLRWMGCGRDNAGTIANVGVIVVSVCQTFDECESPIRLESDVHHFPRQAVFLVKRFDYSITAKAA